MTRKLNLPYNKQVQYLNGYFITGDNLSKVNSPVPHWIPLTKHCFNFTEDQDIPSQMKIFEDLIPTMIQQFTKKKDRDLLLSVQKSTEACGRQRLETTVTAKKQSV